MRNGDFRGTAINPIDPVRAQPFADQMIPAGRIDPAARSIMDFFYPLPNQGTLANGYGVFQQFVPQTRKRHRRTSARRCRGVEERFAVPPRQLPAPRSQQHHLRRGQRVHEPADLDTQLNTASAIGGWTKISRPPMVNEFRAGLQLRQLEARRAHSTAATSRRSSGSRTRPSLGPERSGFRRSSSREATAGRAHQHCRCRVGTWTARSAERLLAQRQRHLDQGRPLVQGGRPLDPQHGASTGSASA